MERKGRAMLFLPVKPRNLGARGLRKNAGKCAGQPSRIREISMIENGAGIRNSSETRLSLSFSLSLSRSVRYGGRRDIYISGRGFAYE